MTLLTPETITQTLSHIVDADSGRDVVSAGMISGIVIRGGKVGFAVTIDPADKDRKAYLREACERVVAALPGVKSVTAVLTAQTPAQTISNKDWAGSGSDDADQTPQPVRGKAIWSTTPIEGVKTIIAVASGKGGVGKSTISVNLALALQRAGKRVGLLDADIYGPSLPRMLGLANIKPEIIDNKMVPPVAHGIACMSMGFITGDEAAILRGPMISKTLHQLLRFSRWDNLDILLVDMPPGTGDIHLSLAQAAPLSGAIIVTTPQEVAVMDARKALKMFLKVEVPILGVIENMSGGIFGTGGGKRLAAEMGVAFLGEIPMDAGIVAASDGGIAYEGKAVGAYDAVIPALVAGIYNTPRLT